MSVLKNPYRRGGMPSLRPLLDGVAIASDPTAPEALFARCPAAHETPLVQLPALAGELGIGDLHIKDERSRMGLGSFKALGAAHAIAKRANEKSPDLTASRPGEELTGITFVCASAGNHGLSVAAGAAAFGARAVIYLAETVPAGFAAQLRAKGADVVVEGADYEASMAAAMHAAEANGWLLLSDSSWPGYIDPARDVMEGYLIMAAEVGRQIKKPPTHIFLQAGVGGLAAACAVLARRLWGDTVQICVVEPEFAPALQSGIAAGELVHAPGPVSAMGRLDCKEASLLALDALARDADAFLTISEQQAEQAVTMLEAHGMPSSPSGVAGFAGLMLASEMAAEFGLTPDSRTLIYLSEGPV